jgi:hypothetical protein
MVFVGELFLLKSADGFGVEHATVSMVRGNEIKVRSSATTTPRSPAVFPLGPFQKSSNVAPFSRAHQLASSPSHAVLPRTLAGAARHPVVTAPPVPRAARCPIPVPL